MGIEFQFVGSTSQSSIALELEMVLSADVGISPHSHIFIIVLFKLGIKIMLGCHIVRLQLHVMVVTHNGEGALKQRLDTVSSHNDPSPANLLVDAVVVNEECFPLVDLVVLPLHLLHMSDIAIFVNEFDV